MRKSKFMKALLIFGMSAVTATSIVGMAACTDNNSEDPNKKPDPEDTCQHQFSGRVDLLDNYMANENDHWHHCVLCDEDLDRGTHKDNNDDGKCDTCGYEVAHSFNMSEWKKDASGHWHAATCEHTTEKGQFAAHVDDDATPNVCDVCGFVGTTSDGYKAFVQDHVTADATKVIDNTFFVANELPVKGSNWHWGTAGLYASDNSATHKVDVSSGKASLITPAQSPATMLLLDWGDVAGSVVEGFFKISNVSGSNGFTAVQFTTSDGTNDSEVFGLRTNKGGAIKYRLDGKTEHDVTGAQTWGSGAGDEGSIEVYYKYDTATNKITVTIGGTAFVTDLQLNGNTIKGIKFSSGDGNADSYAIDDIIVITNPADLGAYKTTVQANAATAVGKITAAGFDVSSATSEAAQTFSAAVNDATTAAQCTDAYNTYYAALVSAYGDAVKNQVNTDYPSTNYDDPKNEDAAAYTAAIAKLGTDVAAANTVEKVTAAYDAAKKTIAGLGDDDYWTAETFNVIVNFGASGTATIPDKRAGDKITKADLDAVVTGLEDNEVITGYTVDGAAVDFGEDGYVLSGEVTFVAVTTTADSDKGTYTYTLKTKTDTSPTIVVKDGSLSDGTGIFSTSLVTTTDFAGWKFGDNNDKIVLTLNVKAGQTITLNLMGYTGSSGNPVAVDVTATNATTAATSAQIVFDSTTSKDAVGKGSLSYTATAAGKVTLTLVRGDAGKGKKTTKITSVSVTVADAVSAG